MKEQSVLVVYCGGDHVYHLFHQAVIGLVHRSSPSAPYIIDTVSEISSPRIAAARNLLVRAGLAHPAHPEWLLMLDTDEVFGNDLVVRLLEVADPVERPIVAGLYFGGRVQGKQNAHLYVLNDSGDAFNPIEGLKGGWGAVVPIHAAGAGCLLMHRDALTTIGEKFADTGHAWFVEGAAAGKDYGEDIAFCLRALSLGIPIHAHTGVILGHLKVGVLDEQTHAEYLARRDTFGDEYIIAENLRRLRVGSQATVKVSDLEPAKEPSAAETRVGTPLPFSLPQFDLAAPMSQETIDHHNAFSEARRS